MVPVRSTEKVWLEVEVGLESSSVSSSDKVWLEVEVVGMEVGTADGASGETVAEKTRTCPEKSPL